MKTYKIYVDCNICNNEFEVEIENYSNKIITDCWHNKLDLNHFEGWWYELNDNIWSKNKEVDFIIKFKNKYWKIFGYTKIQRNIIYYIWKSFHKKEIFEIWECPKCNNRNDMED